MKKWLMLLTVASISFASAAFAGEDATFKVEQAACSGYPAGGDAPKYHQSNPSDSNGSQSNSSAGSARESAKAE